MKFDRLPEISVIDIIARILASLISFGIPFVIGLLVGHFCW